MSVFATLAARARFACAALWLSASPAPAQELLTLEAAMQRTLAVHPDLDDHAVRAQRQAQIDSAAQKPALAAGLQLDNVLGSGAVSGVRAAEVTLTLESVLEARSKRAARMAVADLQLAAVDDETAVRRFDVLAEVARRYLDAAGHVTLAEIVALDIAQRADTVAAARLRVEAGAAPRSQLLAAEAALLRAKHEATRQAAASAMARARLALLWQLEAATVAPDAASFSVSPPATTLPRLAPLAGLRRQLEVNPELIRLANEERLRAARLELARSQSRPDPSWEIGVRRLEAGADFALVAGLRIPLGAAERAQPALAQARAELDALAPERRSRELALAAVLAEAHARYTLLAMSAAQIGAELLPALQAAEEAAGVAYRKGALSYLEWAQLQADTSAARREHLQARLDAQRALIEIQRLTGRTGVEATP